MKNKYEMLTNREKEVLNLVCQGLNNREIANTIYISYCRISIILFQIFNKYEIYDGEKRVKLVLARLRELGKI